MDLLCTKHPAPCLLHKSVLLGSGVIFVHKHTCFIDGQKLVKPCSLPILSYQWLLQLWPRDFFGFLCQGCTENCSTLAVQLLVIAYISHYTAVIKYLFGTYLLNMCQFLEPSPRCHGQNASFGHFTRESLPLSYEVQNLFSKPLHVKLLLREASRYDWI